MKPTFKVGDRVKLTANRFKVFNMGQGVTNPNKVYTIEKADPFNADQSNDPYYWFKMPDGYLQAHGYYHLEKAKKPTIVIED